MYQHLLVPGLQVRLTIPALDKEDVSNKIVEVTETSLVLYAISEGGYLRRVPEGAQVAAWFTAKGARYEFSCEVIENLLEPIAALVVTRPAEIQKIELRRFYRLPKLLPVSFVDNGETQQGYTVNFSAGGMLLAATTALEVGQVLPFSIDLEGVVMENIEGRVVRVHSEEALKNLYGIEFINLSRKEQRQLIQYIFRAQIEMRRLGLL